MKIEIIDDKISNKETSNKMIPSSDLVNTSAGISSSIQGPSTVNAAGNSTATSNKIISENKILQVYKYLISGLDEKIHYIRKGRAYSSSSDIPEWNFLEKETDAQHEILKKMLDMILKDDFKIPSDKT